MLTQYTVLLYYRFTQYHICKNMLNIIKILMSLSAIIILAVLIL